jgi:phosphatidylserine synthase
VVVFAAYHASGHSRLGLLLMAALISTASIRQARFNVAPLDITGTYCGLPRTVSGFVALAYPNSQIFQRLGVGAELGVLVIGVVAALNLVPIPYMTHRGTRKMQGWAKALVLTFFLVPFGTFAFARPYTFDVMLVYAMGYVIAGWVPVLPEERKAFYVEYRRWAAQVATLK